MQINQLDRAYNSLEYTEEKENSGIGPRGLQSPSVEPMSPEAEFVVVRSSPHSVGTKPLLLHRYQVRPQAFRKGGL